MKNAVFAFVSLAFLLGTIPAAPAAQAAPYRYSDKEQSGWPKWIGQIPSFSFSSCIDGTMCRLIKPRPEMAAIYLPLSLIKTGRLEEILQEVENTPNVDTRNWPSWIGGLR